MVIPITINLDYWLIGIYFLWRVNRIEKKIDKLFRIVKKEAED